MSRPVYFQTATLDIPYGVWTGQSICQRCKLTVVGGGSLTDFEALESLHKAEDQHIRDHMREDHLANL